MGPRPPNAAAPPSPEIPQGDDGPLGKKPRGPQPVEKTPGVRGPQPPEALIGFGDMRVKSAKSLA